MKKFINIKDTKNALKDLEEFRSKRYSTIIRLKNVGLKRVNEIVNFTLFYKNDLYVDSDTLFDLMQPEGGKGKKHNYHGLSPELFLTALNKINQLLCIIDEGNNRYAIALLARDNKGNSILLVIETGCHIEENDKANINRLVTMFPKDNLNKYLDSIPIKKIIYLNQIKLSKIK